MSTYRSDKSALDEFLPERALAPNVREGGGAGTIATDVLPSAEVQLDPIEDFPPPLALQPASVQMWPMLAAALVTLGFGILALATFARFFDSSI